MRTLSPPQSPCRAAAPAAPRPRPLPARPARVCFVIDELATAGTETQLVALLGRLDRARVCPHLVLLRGESAASRSLEPAGVPVTRLGIGSLRSGASLRRWGAFVRFLRRERFDVVQAYFPDSSYFALPAARLAGVPHRLRTRNNVGHWVTPLHRFLGRVLGWVATGAVTNCEAARRSLLADERPRADRVAVLENGVDLDRFLAIPAFRPPPGTRPAVIGAVANLRQVKGLDVLVAAAGLLARQGRPLVVRVAGEGSERDALCAQAAASGVALELPGSCSDVPGFLAGLDLAVSASRAEGLSNAVLEYLAAGRPVTATAVGATPDVLAGGACGLLVPPGEPEALAAALARLLDEEGLAAGLAAAGRARARDQYSREAMVARFEDFYTTLTS